MEDSVTVAFLGEEPESSIFPALRELILSVIRRQAGTPNYQLSSLAKYLFPHDKKSNKIYRILLCT